MTAPSFSAFMLGGVVAIDESYFRWAFLIRKQTIDSGS